MPLLEFGDDRESARNAHLRWNTADGADLNSITGDSSPQIDKLILPNDVSRKQQIGQNVIPDAGFCIRTKDRLSNRTLFVNICHHLSVASPAEMDDNSLIQLISDLQTGQREVNPDNCFKIPMCLSEIQFEKDTRNNECLVVDVLIYSSFFQTIQASQVKMMLLQLCTLEKLEIDTKDKYEFEREFTFLKNQKVFGELSSFFIRNPVKEKLISVVECEKKELPIKKTVLHSSQFKKMLICLPGQEKLGIHATFRFKTVNWECLKIFASEREIVLRDGSQTIYRGFLPMEVDQ